LLTLFLVLQEWGKGKLGVIIFGNGESIPLDAVLQK
jgi:hypothetical protein